MLRAVSQLIVRQARNLLIDFKNNFVNEKKSLRQSQTFQLPKQFCFVFHHFINYFFDFPESTLAHSTKAKNLWNKRNWNFFFVACHPGSPNFQPHLKPQIIFSRNIFFLFDSFSQTHWRTHGKIINNNRFGRIFFTKRIKLHGIVWIVSKEVNDTPKWKSH